MFEGGIWMKAYPLRIYSCSCLPLLSASWTPWWGAGFFLLYPATLPFLFWSHLVVNGTHRNYEPKWASPPLNRGCWVFRPLIGKLTQWFLKMLNTESPYEPALTLRMYAREVRTYIHTKLKCRFFSNIFNNSPKRCSYLLTNKQISKMWHIYIMKYHLVIKRNNTDMYIKTPKNLDNITLSEISETQKPWVESFSSDASRTIRLTLMENRLIVARNRRRKKEVIAHESGILFSVIKHSGLVSLWRLNNFVKQ